jgi:uncharacterized integral membrane protein
MKRFFIVLLLLLIGALIAAFAVANRHPVEFVLDPFIDRDLAFKLNFPFYVYLFGATFLGLIAGWLVAWLGQGHWRKTARETHREAAIWKQEAEKLKRGLEASLPKPGAPQPQQRALRSYR